MPIMNALFCGDSITTYDYEKEENIKTLKL